MCGSCGKLLYLTGEPRTLRIFLLVVSTLIGIAMLGVFALGKAEVLNTYDEAKGSFEPSFLAFVLTCTAILFALALLRRFEKVGLGDPSEADAEQLQKRESGFKAWFGSPQGLWIAVVALFWASSALVELFTN